MKLVLINSYKRRSVVLDDNGLPIKDALGKTVSQVKTLFRYGLKDYTSEELTRYRRFRAQDGTDYYREENGVPLYHSNEFLGDTAVLRSYDREDGRVGFSVDDTEIDRLNAMIEKYPSLAPALTLEIMAKKLTGQKLELKPEGDDPEAAARSAKANESLDGKTVTTEEEEEEEDEQ